MLKITLLVIVALVAHTNAVYNTLEWSSCSTAAQTSAIRIERLTVTPMVSHLFILTYGLNYIRQL